jgi:hypothetical protein
MLDSAGSIQQLFQEHVRWAVSLIESLPLEQVCGLAIGKIQIPFGF